MPINSEVAGMMRTDAPQRPALPIVPLAVEQADPGLLRTMVKPGLPAYRAAMPPPDPEDEVAPAPRPAPAVPLQSPPGEGRVVISWGRREGEVVVAIERAPNWDIDEGEIWVLSEEAVVQALPVFGALAKVKNLALVGNDYAAPQVSRPRPARPGDRSAAGSERGAESAPAAAPRRGDPAVPRNGRDPADTRNGRGDEEVDGPAVASGE